MNIKIDTEFIKLDSLIKLSGIASTGGMAKNLIQDGLVMVNDEVETRRGKKIHKGDVVKFEDTEIEVI